MSSTKRATLDSVYSQGGPATSLAEPESITEPEETSLTYRLAMAEHLLEQRVDHALGAIGLTLRQFTVLAQVGRSPGLSRADVARLLLTTPQAVGGLVQRLVTAGLMQRAASVPGLAVGLTLTPAGVAALRAGAPIVRETENTALAGVTRGDRQQVEDVLDRLLTALRE